MTNEHGLEFEETDEDILGKSTPFIRATRDAARRLFEVKTLEDMKDWWDHWGHLFGGINVKRTYTHLDDGLNVGRDLKTALSLMDKHWAGDQNAKDLIRSKVQEEHITVTEHNFKHVVSSMVMDVVDHMSAFPDLEIDKEAWEHLLLFKPISAARAYTELPKMQKVELDEMKDTYKYATEELHRQAVGYNNAIDDIKSKYGDLYVEVN